MKSLFILTAAGLFVAGCSGTTTNTTAAPTAASGYATPTSSISDPAETTTTTASLMQIDQNTGTVSQQNITFTSSATGNFDDFMLTVNGVQVLMTWDAINSRYQGTNGNIEYRVSPWWISTKSQILLDWVNKIDNSGTGTGAWGLVVAGFNSSPSDVAGRTGTATFNGSGGVTVNGADNSFFGTVFGPTSLTANFDTSTIQGTMDLSTVGAFNFGITLVPTTVTINPTSITDNTFNSTASLNLADFGLQSAGTIAVNGMFYESGATGVGGYLTGTGTSLGGGTPTLINGAFAAAE